VVGIKGLPFFLPGSVKVSVRWFFLITIITEPGNPSFSKIIPKRSIDDENFGVTRWPGLEGWALDKQRNFL